MKKVFSIMLGIAAMLTSCSQNDEVLNVSNEAQEVKFSLTAENQLQSRANDLRYVMAVYDESGENAVIAETVYDSNTFSIRLEPGKYTCLFWADYGNANYDANSLKNITLQDNATNIEAFFAKKIITISDNGEEEVTLRRAVAQVSLKETDYLAPGTMTVTYSEFSGFDVNAESAVNKANATKTINIAETIQANPSEPIELGSFLMLANPADCDLCTFKVKYASEPEKTITNVPIQANHRTYIIGKYGLTYSRLFTITIDENWEDDDNTVEFPPYLTFSAESEQTLSVPFNNYGFNDFKLGEDEFFEYSVGGSKWVRFTSTIENISFGGSLGNLRLRGKSSQGTSDESTFCKFVFGASDVMVDCTGDIRTLIDYANYQTVNTGNARFTNLFGENPALITAPELPATNLASGCYYGMFSKCTSLVKAPELPATTLSSDCYSGMFYFCESLTEAPELPAETLAENCYMYMFQNCSSLTKAPVLNAMNLAENCYASMFMDCSSLIEAPELPATTLANYCYMEMFRGCTSLTKAPLLHAQKLPNGCYQLMFANCPKLAEVTMLATDISGKYCFINWLGNHDEISGTQADSRKLTLANQGIYDSLVSSDYTLPEIWREGQATIIYANQEL